MSRIRVAVAGACGRMGQEVVRTVLAQTDMELVGALDVEAGADIGLVAAGRAVGVTVSSTPESLLSSQPQVLVEFTRFDIAPLHLRPAAAAGVSLVIGTTGLAARDLEELGQTAAQHDAGCFVAPNFSLGAVLMMQFAQQAARYFDWAEIIELHHEKKADAPSGTALRTGELMRTAHQQPFQTPAQETLKLDGVRGGMKDGIRIHSVRLPGYLAHQEVMFGGDGEVLSIRHDSTNRTSFMPGVALAIRRVLGIRGLVVGLEHLMGDPS